MKGVEGVGATQVTFSTHLNPKRENYERYDNEENNENDENDDENDNDYE